MSESIGFSRLCEIIRTLRAPGGCPWDQEQTPRSLRGSLIEETYESIDAIDSGAVDHVREELGDLLMLVVFLAVMYEETGAFSVADVLSGVNDKLVRRHPHVFADATADTPDQVVRQWDRIKSEEEGKPSKDLYLDSVGDTLPALERSYAIQKAAAKVGFDWPDLDGVIAKLNEEVREVRHEIDQAATDDRIESELGDLLFSAVNIARYLNVDPSIALHKTNQKFKLRFGRVELELRNRGRTLDEAGLEEMDDIWNRMRDSS